MTFASSGGERPRPGLVTTPMTQRINPRPRPPPPGLWQAKSKRLHSQPLDVARHATEGSRAVLLERGGGEAGEVARGVGVRELGRRASVGAAASLPAVIVTVQVGQTRISARRARHRLPRQVGLRLARGRDVCSGEGGLEGHPSVIGGR